MVKRLKLNEIATIRAGHTFRDPPEEARGSEARILHIRDIKTRFNIDVSALAEIEWNGGDKGVMQSGEIVVAARGLNNRAAWLAPSPNGERQERVIPSNQLLVLSINTNLKTASVLPEYLCWALNHANAQRQINQRRTGTNIPMINKQDVSDIAIPVPTMGTQKRIIQLHKRHQHEHVLLEKLWENTDKMYQGLYQSLLTNVEKEN